jgi:hypothetical protein
MVEHYWDTEKENRPACLVAIQEAGTQGAKCAKKILSGRLAQISMILLAFLASWRFDCVFEESLSSNCWC